MIQIYFINGYDIDILTRKYEWITELEYEYLGNRKEKA